MICCGEHRTTPFCPQCGKPITASLCSLLAYLRKMQAQCEQQAEARKQRAVEMKRGADAPFVVRRVNAATKWKAWADAVEKSLENPT